MLLLRSKAATVFSAS